MDSYLNFIISLFLDETLQIIKFDYFLFSCYKPKFFSKWKKILVKINKWFIIEIYICKIRQNLCLRKLSLQLISSFVFSTIIFYLKVKYFTELTIKKEASPFSVNHSHTFI